MMNTKFIAAGVAALVVAFGGGIVVQKVVFAPPAEANPFGLPAMTAEEQKAEEGFLRIDLSGTARDAGEAPVSVPTENVPVRRCPQVPERADPSFGAGTAEASARRLLYGLAQAERVLAMQDCTCTGKVAPWSAVVEREAALRAEFGAKWSAGPQFDALFNELKKKEKLVEQLCGGEF